MSIFLKYQLNFLEAIDKNQVVVYEKSRRIGITWAAAYYALEQAAATAGCNVYYISYNESAAKEFVEDVKKWSRAVNIGFEATGQELINNQDKDELSFFVRFNSGFKIVALCSSPRVLRGKQGLIIIDEAAFHDNLGAILTSALAMLVWGGKVVIISTHDGDDNAFYKMVEDIRKKVIPYKLLRTTFDEAIADGLYDKICEKQKKPNDVKNQDLWRLEIINQYASGADEELFCIPRKSYDSSYLPLYLTSGCVDVGCKVIRFECAPEFVNLSSYVRSVEARGFCEAKIEPILEELADKKEFSLGMDFARSTLSVISIGYKQQDTKLIVPLMLELYNVPFDEQEQILWYLIYKLNIKTAALDARGNGEVIAERAAQQFGQHIAGIKATTAWYGSNFPPLKRAFETHGIAIPKDQNVLDDLSKVQIIKGVPSIPNNTNQKSASASRHAVFRHADAAVSLLLLHYASFLEASLYEFDEELNEIKTRTSAY